MSSDEDFLGARASRPHKAWHGLAYLSPLRSTANGTVPGLLCKGCSRFVPQNHSPLEGESQKPSRQAKADAVGGWTPACVFHKRNP